MSIRIPRFPYCDLRDDRPRREMAHKRLTEICDTAAVYRRRFCDLFGVFDALLAVQHGLPDGVYFIPDDRHFIAERGFMKGVEAFCDFSKEPIVFMREYIWDDLHGERTGCAKRRHAFEVIAHELGHVHLPSHKRKLNARAKKASLSMVRAAHNKDPGNREDSLALRARNLDLEEEADCFQYACLVPVTELDGSLSIMQLSDQYDVTKRTAYEAAMLAKDYRRALFLEQLKSGK